MTAGRTRAKYRALEKRVREIEKVVDRCLTQRGSHLPVPTAAAIRAAVMRTAEGLLCFMTTDELDGDDPVSKALRSRLAVEIEGDTVKAINEAVKPFSGWVN